MPTSKRNGLAESAAKFAKPPQQRRSSKKPPFLELDEEEMPLPTAFFVRAPPSTSVSKQMRHYRRVYLHQAIMRGMGLVIGELLVVQPEGADEDDAALAAFGVAFPSADVEINCVQLHDMLRASHLLEIGDRVKLVKYQARPKALKQLTVCCLDELPRSTAMETKWTEALRAILVEIRYVTDGMEFECAVEQAVLSFTIVGVQEDPSRSPRRPTQPSSSIDQMNRQMSNLQFDDTSEGESEDVPDLFLFDQQVAINIDRRSSGTPQAEGANASRSASSRPPSRQYTPSRQPTPRQAPSSNARATGFTPKTTPAAKASPTKSPSSAAKRPAKDIPLGRPKIEEIDSDEEEAILAAAQGPRIDFDSIGGLAAQIESLREIVELPLSRPEIFKRFNMSPPRGVLLYGPPGTGKTLLLRAVASETTAKIFLISGPSIVSKYMGEAEEKLRKIWQEAQKKGPSIIFIDEIDAITPRRDHDSGEAESRIVASLLTLMDGMDVDSKVVVVGATNRPNSMDPALRRPGRFDREIEIGIPDAKARLDILNVILNTMPHHLSEPFIANLAGKTHGFVGADLSAVVREAVVIAVKDGVSRSIPQEDLYIEEAHLIEALPLVRPSAMREIFLETPQVRWSDIGGQEEVKRKLRESVEIPLTHPETFKRLGIVPPKGVLLYGPPGCSKTLTAKALATEAGLNFLAVKGPEIFNKYVGEAERALREIFRKARAASPSIIFFDEIDALTGTRDGGEGSSDRILTTLLNELDGVEDLINVTVLAATNRPDVIDTALLRPGRLDRLLYVGPPDYDSRLQILRLQLAKMAVSKDLDTTTFAKATDGCSGAEIVAFCRDAGLAAMQESLDAKQIEVRHFENALQSLRKGITPEMIAFFESFEASVTG
jgi:AAA family ATPase